MRLARILSLVVLVAVLFVTVDLGISCLGALVPELQDGIPYYSLLQRWFGVWEGRDAHPAGFLLCVQPLAVDLLCGVRGKRGAVGHRHLETGPVNIFFANF